MAPNFLSQLLDTRTLSPHGICLLWRPELLWTHVVSDAVIGLAYMTIPVALVVIIRRRRDIPFTWMIWCFALFITACGVTHFMSIWTLWRPDYGVEALFKVVTALASITTAILLWTLIPLAVSLPSPGQLSQLNTELQARVEERDRAIADLRNEKVERVRAEEALLQSQKMDALGQLTGGIAHDFNNLLQAVQGSLELIRRRAADVVKVQQLAEGGLRATERGARLTSQLLAFSRSKQLDLQPLLLDEMVAEMRDLLQRTLGSTMDLRFDLDADSIPVMADRTQLELAVLNLAINARDASKDGGCIVVRTRSCNIVTADPDLKPGAYGQLSVSDTGKGMSAEVRAKAFDPFFTTKTAGQSAGLGLSQVYGVARQAGGVARIDSKPGEGTTVSLFLPGAAEREKQSAPAKPAPVCAVKSAKILVVDDDDDVRQCAVDALDLMGHVALEAANGHAALAMLKRETPDLLLVDYAMPGMTGAELVRRARRLWPDLTVLFVTGYADAEALEAVLSTREVVLRKPYQMIELESAVAASLNRRSALEDAGVSA